MSCAIITISILVSISGLLANLLFPNLDWKNEVAVVKRSIAMIVNLISVLIYIGILILPYYLLKFTNINIILISIIIITSFINILIWSIIKIKGVKMFRRL